MILVLRTQEFLSTRGTFFISNLNQSLHISLIKDRRSCLHALNNFHNHNEELKSLAILIIRNMRHQIKLTLGELSRIALGTQSLGPRNIALLHCLIGILLKKLGCHDEKVKIGGYETNILKIMLANSKRPDPFVFHDDNLEIIATKFDCITQLEKHVETVQERITNHFDDIDESNKHIVGGEYDYQKFEYYAGVSEDLCVGCKPVNDYACDLLKNVDFMKKILRRITFPMVNRIFKFEQIIETLADDFTKFMEKTSQHYLKMALIERCIEEMIDLRQQVEDHRSEFVCGMEEVQDMIDGKLDKTQLPELKKYVHAHFKGVETILNSMKTTSSPIEDDPIMNGIKCISCGNDKVFLLKSVDIQSTMPVAHTRTKARILKKFCCFKDESSTVKEVHLSANDVATINLKPKNAQTRSCLENKYVLKKGKNKIVYRMALNEGYDKKEEVKLANMCKEDIFSLMKDLK